MIDTTLLQVNACVLIPTYNNAKTLTRVLDGVLKFGDKSNVIVINDGSTDETLHILEAYQDRVSLITYNQNKGKGNALKLGFKKAISLGYTYAITIDSDGQHFPDDIALFLTAIQETPDTLIMGSRNMEQEGVPGKSSFGNKFSNFWFKLETGITLPDTQTGFRLYPLEPLKKIRLFTSKFETEIEVIVKMAWKGVKFMPLNIKVLYDPNERVSHFRPFRDFTRISILNTYFVILTALFYLPKRILFGNKKELLNRIKKNLLAKDESPMKKAVSIGFGVFMGITPIWGFQMLAGLPIAMLFKMNKVIFITASNISIPPFIPFIIFGSYYCGSMVSKNPVSLPPMDEISLAILHLNYMQYALGAMILATAAGIIAFLVSYVLFSRTKRTKSVEA